MTETAGAESDGARTRVSIARRMLVAAAIWSAAVLLVAGWSLQAFYRSETDHQLDLSLAVTSGVHFAEDVLKAILAGADVAMMTSLLLRHGPETIRRLLPEISHWLETGGYSSIEQMKGSMSLKNCPDASQLERANYMKALTSYTDT